MPLALPSCALPWQPPPSRRSSRWGEGRVVALYAAGWSAGAELVQLRLQWWLGVVVPCGSQPVLPAGEIRTEIRAPFQLPLPALLPPSQAASGDSRILRAGAEIGAWTAFGYIFQSAGLLTTDASRASFLSTFTVLVRIS